MKKTAASLLVVLALAAAAGAPAAAPPGDVQALTRIAGRLSGLRPARRVVVRTLSPAAMRTRARLLLDRDYPAAQQAYDETLYRGLGLLGPTQPLRPELLATTRDVLGLYDPVTRVLFVRRGGTRRAALVHELVHALEDQRFHLGHATLLRRSDRDAALAAAAAIEGDAAFSTQVLGGRVLAVTGRRVAAAAGDPLARFLRLEQQFPETVGLRFAATLHNLGGNDAVFSALERLPATTEQIFHIDAFLMREPALPVTLPRAVGGLALRRSDTFGELDVRALLAVFAVPGLDVAAAGWGGGRSAVYADAAGRPTVAVVLDWDSEQDAQEWAAAVGPYLRGAFGVPAGGSACPDGVACWTLDAGRAAELAVAGPRTALVLGADPAAAAALAAAAVAG